MRHILRTGPHRLHRLAFGVRRDDGGLRDVVDLQAPAERTAQKALMDEDVVLVEIERVGNGRARGLRYLRGHPYRCAPVLYERRAIDRLQRAVGQVWHLVLHVQHLAALALLPTLQRRLGVTDRVILVRMAIV